MPVYAAVSMLSAFIMKASHVDEYGTRTGAVVRRPELTQSAAPGINAASSQAHPSDEFRSGTIRQLRWGSVRRDRRMTLQAEKPAKTVIDFSGERRRDAPVPVPEGAWVGEPDSGQIDRAATRQITG